MNDHTDHIELVEFKACGCGDANLKVNKGMTLEEFKTIREHLEGMLQTIQDHLEADDETVH